MKTWHWIALAGIAGVVGYFLLRSPSGTSTVATGPIAAPPAFVPPPPVVGPSSEARSGRGHF